MTEPDKNISQLTDHLFRREAGKMVSFLTKIFGTENLQMAEDVVQDTLLKAYNTWPVKGIPDNPSAWLFRVAKNKAIDHLRHNRYLQSTDHDELLEVDSLPDQADAPIKQDLLQDDMLRMMFACCHPKIPAENQITLILKTLCGFNTIEIAKAFLIPEDTVSKRLYRTKEFFRKEKIKLSIPSIKEIKNRTNVILNAIYLLFNEGYNSTQSEYLIRQDLMQEAMLLCQMITKDNNTQQPEAYALMALMCFQASRTDSRLSPEGEIILLAHQDRKRWDYQLIVQGNHYMNQAAYGGMVSAYHLEAAIAFEHCTASSFETTNWQQILTYYNWLCDIAPSPFTELNRVVVIMQVEGPETALNALIALSSKYKTEKFYLFHAISGEIHLRMGDTVAARNSLEKAIGYTHSAAEKHILQQKLAICLN